MLLKNCRLRSFLDVKIFDSLSPVSKGIYNVKSFRKFSLKFLVAIMKNLKIKILHQGLDVFKGF